MAIYLLIALMSYDLVDKLILIDLWYRCDYAVYGVLICLLLLL